jgi:hypothetical protein
VTLCSPYSSWIWLVQTQSRQSPVQANCTLQLTTLRIPMYDRTNSAGRNGKLLIPISAELKIPENDTQHLYTQHKLAVCVDVQLNYFTVYPLCDALNTQSALTPSHGPLQSSLSAYFHKPVKDFPSSEIVNSISPASFGGS